MRRYDYPDVSAHKAQHDALAAQVLDLQKKYQSGETSLGIGLMMFLKEWLEKHIAGSDQKYGVFIRPKLAA